MYLPAMGNISAFCKNTVSDPENKECTCFNSTLSFNCPWCPSLIPFGISSKSWKFPSFANPGALMNLIFKGSFKRYSIGNTPAQGNLICIFQLITYRDPACYSGGFDLQPLQLFKNIKIGGIPFQSRA